MQAHPPTHAHRCANGIIEPRHECGHSPDVRYCSESVEQNDQKINWCRVGKLEES